MPDNSHSHSHANNCGQCTGCTTHRVDTPAATIYIHGGPDIHTHTNSSDTYAQDSPGAPTNNHQNVSGCNGACTRLDTICKSLQMTNMAMSSEVSRLKNMQPSDTTTLSYSHPNFLPPPHSTAGGTPVNYWGTDKVISCGNGAGAGSREIYEEMCRTNWHGHLGRTTMAEVDRLSPEKLKDLDDFLHRNIAKCFPYGGKLVEIAMEPLWAGFKEIGIRLEERTYFADITDSGDHPTWPAMQRMRNRAAWCHQDSVTWKYYWNGFASETLLECARYRGLFRSDGTLP